MCTVEPSNGTVLYRDVGGQNVYENFQRRKRVVVIGGGGGELAT